MLTLIPKQRSTKRTASGCAPFFHEKLSRFAKSRIPADTTVIRRVPITAQKEKKGIVPRATMIVMTTESPRVMAKKYRIQIFLIAPFGKNSANPACPIRQRLIVKRKNAAEVAAMSAILKSPKITISR